MHDVTIERIATQDIRHNFTKSLGIQTLVNVFDGLVHIFLGCGNATQDISLIAVHCDGKSKNFFANVPLGRIKDKVRKGGSTSARKKQ
jgi:hypothetical protein